MVSLGYISEIWNKYEDPRTAGKFLMENPPTRFFGFIISYVLFIHFGPTLMKKRKPFELKLVKSVYNIFQIVINGYYGLYGLYYVFLTHNYNYSCPSLAIGNDEYAQTIAHLGHIYFLSKLWDLFDTIFIILKKNDRQLSFLHCYHHMFMAFATYFIMKFYIDTSFCLVAVINALIHSCMYFYYFLTTQNSEVKKSITWKKHITHIQMLQFTVLSIHFLRPVFNTECNRPKVWDIFMSLQILFILYMFIQFYIKTYLVKKNSNKKKF
ncbi:hypothetical protein PVAND_017633 [Polypedilum vanderplanki]|uniref:Elongation of very long chain fatty acids protein n=1 Tax=Polypedilum vanderplanki TaxID=319348 RepID=A0A9J6B8Z7_POLVA|nr:hypothetical protein PVAND_017633 [Polypedilum vanderplanki]